ncbi:MAG TPA: GNAT family N-acetyltransferase [Candidatus Limnocylindrales bacterium]|nr:GNAT family N-acetyltransferase [Candidatus Limnocylindrales bacterium]
MAVGGCEGEVRLRRAGPADAADIARVQVTSWRKAYRGLLPDDYLERLDPADREPSWRRGIESWPLEGHPWLAEVGGRVVGFVSAGPSRDEGAAPSTAEVYAIYVDPDCWDRGIGTALLGHAVRDLRAARYETATLWVLAGNRQGRGFYEKSGWRPDGALKSEPIGGVSADEVRYRLDLAGAPSPRARPASSSASSSASR